MEIYDDPKHFARAFVKHFEKYKKAKQSKDRFEACMQYGAMNNIRIVLQQKFGFTTEDIEALKNGQPPD